MNGALAFCDGGGLFFFSCSFSTFSSMSANPIGRVHTRIGASCPGPDPCPGFARGLLVWRGLFLLIQRIPNGGDCMAE